MEHAGRRTRGSRDAQAFQRSLYDQEILAHGQEAYLEGILGRRLIQERISFVAPYISTGCRVLDIGAGDGSVSRAMAERGATVVGIDVCESAIDLANRCNPHSAVEYLHDTVEEYETRHTFDVVTAFEVLEHVYDPQLLFDRVASFLRSGGIFCVSTPNRRSIEWYAAYLLRRVKGADLEPMFRMDPRHVRELDHFELLDLGYRSKFQVREARGVILLNRVAVRSDVPFWLRELVIRAARNLPELSKDQYVVFQKP